VASDKEEFISFIKPFIKTEISIKVSKRINFLYDPASKCMIPNVIEEQSLLKK
jgi:hypothetical protein